MLWSRLLRRLDYRWRIAAVVLAMLAVNVGWASRHSPHETVPLALLGTLPLLGLRRNPLAVLGVVLATMVVQAAAANDVFDSHPERAREALQSIEHTGRLALTELRRLLGAVRTPEEEAFAPQPGLSALPGLVEGVRAAGLPVTLHVEGEL